MSRPALWSPTPPQAGPDAAPSGRTTSPNAPQAATCAPVGPVLARVADLHEQLAQANRELARILENQLDGRGIPGLMSSVDTTSAPKVLLGTREVALRLGLSERTVRRARKRGDLPPGVEIGGVIRWRSEEIEEWLAR